jgi:hypothetical protein
MVGLIIFLIGIYILSALWCFFEIKCLYSIYGKWYGLDIDFLDMMAITMPIANLIIAIKLFIERE